jgi:hypothetical protein
MYNSGIPVLRQKEDASTELEIDTGSAGDNLDDDDNALGRRRPCFCDSGPDSIGSHTTTDRPHFAPHVNSGGSDAVHFGTEVAEDDCGLFGGGELLDNGGELGRGTGPVWPRIGPLELGPHAINIDLGMDQKLLDPHVELELQKSRHMSGIHLIGELVRERAKEDALLGSRADLETVTDKGGSRWQRVPHGDPEILHGAAEHDGGSDGAQILGTDVEPFTEIFPVSVSVLDGSGTENPPTLGLERDADPGTPALGGKAIADDVTFVENDSVKAAVVLDMEMCPVVGGEEDVGDATEFLCPSAEKSRRTQNESPIVEGRVAEKTDGLVGLAESHVIGENAASACGGSDIFSREHPADSLLLVREVVDTGLGRLQGHRHQSK